MVMGSMNSFFLVLASVAEVGVCWQWADDSDPTPPQLGQLPANQLSPSSLQG